MTSKKYFFALISIILITLLSYEVLAGTNVPDCGITINISGQYELNAGISGTATCLTINTSNIELDCKGNTISYGSDGVNGRIGISVALGTVYLENITIKNCIIQDTNPAGTTGYGIYALRTSNSYIINNTINTSGTATNHGIYLSTASQNNLLENNTINAYGSTTGNYGIYLIYQSNNNTIRNNEVKATGTTTSYALMLYSSEYNLIENNNFSSYTLLTTGNSDMNVVYLYYGSRYNILRNNYIYSDAEARNYHIYLNLNNNYNIIANNTIIPNDDEGTNPGIYILGSDYNLVENNTIRTNGTTANYGVWLGVSSTGNMINKNNIITNGTTTNNYGIYLVSALYNNITENQISSNGLTTGNAGITLSSAQRNYLARNNISTSGTTTGYGIYLTGSDYDTVEDNDISTFGTSTANDGIYLISSTNNNIINNRITANSTSSGNIGIALYTSTGNSYVYNNTIKTDGTTTNYGILLQTANNNSIVNNQISTSGTTTTNHGIYLYISANANKIYYNNISTYGTTTNHGISLSTTSDRNEIVGNYIIANGSTTASATTTNNFGIAAATSCYNNLMENNTILNSGGRYNYGIYISVESGYSTIRGNNITTGGSGATNAGIYLSESRNNLLEENIISTSGSATDYGIYLYSNAKYNFVKKNNITTSGSTNSYGILLDAVIPNFPHNNSFQENNFISIAGTEFRFADAEIDENYLISQIIDSYLFTGIGSKMIVRNDSAGEIKFLDRLTGSGTGFSDDVYILENYAFIDSSIPGLNKSAEITIYNLPTTSNELQIYRNGIICSDCFNLTSMQAGNVTFNVTQGGGYSINSSSSSPLIELDFPENDYLTNQQNINFNFTARDDSVGDLNCSIYIDSILNQTNSTTQNNTLTNFAASGLTEGNHNWNIECFDSAGNRNISETINFTITISQSSSLFNYPENKSYFNNLDFILLNYTVLDLDLKIMTAWIYGDEILLNTTSGLTNGSSLVYNWTSLDLGQYNWSIIIWNGIKNSSIEYSYFNNINLTINCEAGGDYLEDPTVLIQGRINDSSGIVSLSSQIINISIYNDSTEEIITSSNITTESNGVFNSIFPGLEIGNYTVYTKVNYQGIEINSSDSFKISLGYEAGYNAGFIAGNESGYISGFDYGNITGFNLGNITGFILGNNTGFTLGNTTGFVYGNLTGFVLGNSTGYILGNATGFTLGNYTGFILGNQTGFIIGNISGFNLGNSTGFTLGNYTGFILGNISGFYFGNQTGYTTGYNAGFIAGNESGYISGFDYGNITGFNLGNITGFILGNNTGFTLGNSTGYTLGFNTGNITGFTLGNTTGFVYGNNTGYILGFNTGNLTGFTLGNTTGFVLGNSTGYILGNATGFVYGNTTGFILGNTTGFVYGNITGFALGNSTGFTLGNFTGYILGNQTGFYYGNTSGYNAGFSTGNTTGFNLGNTTGFTYGNLSGFDLGNATGYTLGYNAGVNVSNRTSASLVLDKIASLQNITNGTISYNVTLRLTNKGGSNSTGVNITDLDYGSNFTIGNLTAGESVTRSYIINFTRNMTTYSNATSIAHAYGLDSYLSVQILANSSSMNLPVPSNESEQQLTLIKNVFYINQTSTNVNYTVSFEVINSGGLDLTGITITDDDLGISDVISLSKTQSHTYSGSLIISKNQDNKEQTFSIARGNVNSVIYSSNQIKVLIPGYGGGPNDVSINAPTSVLNNTNFNVAITVKNKNKDIGQDFILTYWLLSNDETSTYSTGAQTLYVGGNDNTNATTIVFLSPSVNGTYKIRANVSGTGVDVQATALSTILVTYPSNETENETPVNPPHGGGGGGGKTSCTYIWECGSWSLCSDEGTQSRTCTNTGTCTGIEGKPAEKMNCLEFSSDIVLKLSQLNLTENQSLEFNIALTEKKSYENKDVQITYSIFNKTNIEVFTKTETRSLETNISYKEILDELMLTPGEYTLKVYLLYGNSQSSEEVQPFIIKEEGKNNIGSKLLLELTPKTNLLTYLAIFVILILLISLFVIMKKKRDVDEVDLLIKEGKRNIDNENFDEALDVYPVLKSLYKHKYKGDPSAYEKITSYSQFILKSIKDKLKKD